MKNANPLSLVLIGLLFCLLPGWAGCDSGKPGVGEQKPANAYFPILVGSQTVSLQLAVSEAEMARGLMGRRDLGPDQGMLFIYARPQAMSFWMRNTPTALDIGFFDVSGILREVYPMYPYDETSVRSRAKNLMYALEVNQGWFAAKGVKLGDKLDLIAVAKALRERGFAGKGVEEASSR